MAAGAAIGVAGGEALSLACGDGDCTNEVITVYRVWGSDPENPGIPGAGPWGRSWTPVNPRTVENFRDFAGLPSGGASGAFNAGRFVSVGKLTNMSGVTVNPAWSLDGLTGGLSEFVIPNPEEQIHLLFVGGVNPPY